MDTYITNTDLPLRPGKTVSRKPSVMLTLPLKLPDKHVKNFKSTKNSTTDLSS